MPAAKAGSKAANAAARVAKAAVKAATTAADKESKPVPKGLAKVLPVSPVLKKFLGVGEINRSDTMKMIWTYIKGNQLQNPANMREIVCDEKLKLVLGKDRVQFLEVPRLLNSHFPSKENKKP